jgi:predicted dehydrogenase
VDFKPVTMGVLGYGHFIRTNFIKHLRNCPHINIVGVYNRGEERRKQAEQDGYWATSDLDELLALPGLESVLIGTANDVHREHAIAAARAGKHILCEKPLALSLPEIDQMVEAVDKAGVLSHVNHGGPYTEASQKIRELANKFCGKIMQVWIRNSRLFGTWKMGARHFAVANPDVSGGWTMHHECHFVNAACWLIPSPATKVYHVKQKSCDEAPSEESVTTIIHYADGSTALLSDGTTIGGFTDTGIQGSDGDLRLLGDEITLVTHGEPDPTQRPGNRSQVVQKFKVAEQGKVLTKVGQVFAEAVRSGDGRRLLSFRQIRHEYQIMAAMLESARTGQVADVK